MTAIDSKNHWIQQFTTDEQTQIIKAMGYNNASEVPEKGKISSSSLGSLVKLLPKDLSARVLTAVGMGGMSNPKLEESKLGKSEFPERVLQMLMLMSAIEELQTEGSSNSLKLKREQIEDQSKLRLSKLAEVNEKMKTAETVGIVLKALSWAAVALSVVVSAVVLGASIAAAVASGGTATALVGVAVAAAGLLIAGASAAVVVLEETGVADMALNAVFGDNQGAKDGVKIGIQIGLLVATLVTAGVGLFAAGANIVTAGVQAGAKAASAAAKASMAAAKVAQLAVKAALDAMMAALKSAISGGASNIGKVAKLAETLGALIQSGATITQGVATGVNAGVQLDLALTKVGLKDSEALLALLQQMMDMLLEAYQDMITSSEEAVGKLGEALKGYQSASMSILGSSGA